MAAPNAQAGPGRPAFGEHGFTLIEILVASAITVVLAGLMLGVANNIMSSWTRSSGKLGAQAQARSVLDQLTLDLQSALFRDDGNVWLAATVLDTTDNSSLWQAAARQKPAGHANGSLNLMADSFAATRYGQAGVWLRFFTFSRGSDNPSSSDMVSAPVAVAYQIIRRRAGGNPAGTAEKYFLHRSTVRPAQEDSRPGLLETGCNLDPAVGNDYSRSGSINDGTQPGDPFSIRHPDNAGCVLADDVVDFGVRFLVRGPDGLQQVFPTEADDLEHLAKSPADSGAFGERFPEVVDVMVRVLTAEGARLIAIMEANPAGLGPRPPQYPDDAAWWWGLVEAHSQVLTRRVCLPLQSG